MASAAWKTGTRSGGRKSTQGKTMEPLPMVGAPRRGYRRVEWFCRRHVITPSGKGAGKPFEVRAWQRDRILKRILPEDRRRRPRQALIEMAGGNGKSGLAVVLAVYFAFADGVESPEVLLVASNERQAERLLNKVWRIIQRNPELESRCELYKSAGRIEIGFNGGAIIALPSKFDALQGYAPTFVILDEAHVVDQEVYDALVTRLGKNPDVLLLIISTPGDSTDSLLWRLSDQGRAGGDPKFVHVTFAAPDGCDPLDRRMWELANPALGDFLFVEGLEAAASSLLPHRVNMFRRIHLCQWAGSEDQWIPWGRWDVLADRRMVVPPGTPITVGFDGSWTRDATALVGCTLPTETERPHLFVLGFWEWTGPGWRVPLEEVDRAVDYAFETFDVRELTVDKSHWKSEVARWRKRWGDTLVLDVPQNAARMVPATDRLYQAVMDGLVTHDGHEGMARHMHNAVAVTRPGGVVINKPKDAPSKDSAVGRIDAAVAGLMAHDSAWIRSAEPPPRSGTMPDLLIL